MNRKNHFLILGFMVILAAPLRRIVASPPTSFTYQGSLKQNGAPLNGTYAMEFRITNADGTFLYWTSGPQTVSVAEGLYRQVLDPGMSVDWANIVPYMETRVNGITFLPREKITATLYAFSSRRAETVRDGSIQPASLDLSSFTANGPGIVPPGGILMFLGVCPAGYSEVTALRDRFPMGADVGGTSSLVPDAPNQTFGSTGHQHTINHTHQTGIQTNFSGSESIRTNNAWVSFSHAKEITGYDAAGTGDNIGMNGVDHIHITGQPSSTVSGTTDTLPPGLTVTFCKKL